MLYTPHYQPRLDCHCSIRKLGAHLHATFFLVSIRASLAFFFLPPIRHARLWLFLGPFQILGHPDQQVAESSVAGSALAGQS